METALVELLAELDEFGRDNDASTDDRARKMLNITHETGEFLALLVKATRARHVLEIGTSNGYSTLWLADAVGPDGTVTTVERAEAKRWMAAHNFERAGLGARIRQLPGDADTMIAAAEPGEYDFVFLDSDRDQYAGWWEGLHRLLAPGQLMVVDNAVSHAEQLAEFTRRVLATKGCVSSLSPIGKGELVILTEA
jgi:predicted O-methyltransferase YrrM